MPGVCRTRSLACNEKSTQASHHRYAKTVRHSLRNGVNDCSVLSSVLRYSIHTFFRVRVVPYLMRRKSSRPIRITFGPGFP
jgi:hypothetical protein